MRPASLVLAVLASGLLACQDPVSEREDPPTTPSNATQDIGQASARTVDPATLTPDPVFASDEGTSWSCRVVGTGVMCVGHKTTRATSS